MKTHRRVLNDKNFIILTFQELISKYKTQTHKLRQQMSRIYSHETELSDISRFIDIQWMCPQLDCKKKTHKKWSWIRIILMISTNLQWQAAVIKMWILFKKARESIKIHKLWHFKVFDKAWWCLKLLLISYCQSYFVPVCFLKLKSVM